jgi:hypothetical protein
MVPYGPSSGSSIASMHLRPPSIDKGIIAGAWGVGLGLFLFLGMLSVGVSRGVAFVLAALSGAAIFLFVRINGEEERGRQV